jgi:hypothetical protein
MGKFLLVITRIVCLLVLFGCAPQGTASPTIAPTTSVPATVAPTAVQSTEQLIPDRFSVVVAVFDDFGPAGGGTESLQPPDKKENCLVTPYGQGQYGSRGASIGSTKKPHGELVYSTLSFSVTQLLSNASPIESSSTGSSFVPSPGGWLRHIDVWRFDGADIILVGVDTLGFTTSVVSQRIQDVISLFSGNTSLDGQALPKIDRYVLNMSFAIVPCDPDFGLNISDSAAQDEYNRIAADPNLQELKNRIDALTSAVPFTESVLYVSPTYNISRTLTYYAHGLLDPAGLLASDPLVTETRSLVKSSTLKVIPVASAGNFDIAFPFLPAGFDEIVSASAEYAPSDKFSSNAGEVRLWGYSMSMPFPGTSPAGTVAAGTSFAAPRLSALEALYLLRGGGNSCAGPASSQPSQPPLGYSTGSGPWNNLAVAAAAMQYCPGF